VAPKAVVDVSNNSSSEPTQGQWTVSNTVINDPRMPVQYINPASDVNAQIPVLLISIFAVVWI
jgi:hypothetical protein